MLGADGGKGALAAASAVRSPACCIWTLTEYWLHRLVFHWDPDHPVGHRLHFIIHGVHHDHPNDKMRLVMPPGGEHPAGRCCSSALFWLIFGTPTAYPLFAGFLVGYLIYDYTHYYLHHFVPKSELGKQLARAAHAPPLPGPPLRLRRLLPALGRGLPHPAAHAPQSANRYSPKHCSVLLTV